MRIAAVMLLVLLAVPARAEIPDMFTGVRRIVAIGDIHGDHDKLVALLRRAGLLDVRGATTLDGTLKVTKAPGYTPAAGQQFTAALFVQPPAGQFASVDDAALGASLKLNPTLIPANLTLNIAAR